MREVTAHLPQIDAGDVRYDEAGTAFARAFRGREFGLVYSGPDGSGFQSAYGAPIQLPVAAGKLAHIFSRGVGHVAPRFLSSQQRFVRLFSRVASNPANANPAIASPAATAAGQQGFSQVFRNGQVWVLTRGGQIMDAGVNSLKNLR